MIPVAAFDLETTGTDVETARIVSAAIVTLDEHGRVTRESWLINPGVPIPPEATEVHGITDEQVRAHGQEPGIGLTTLLDYLENACQRLPLVVFNAPFDLTILDREVRRHELSLFVGDIGGNDLGLWWEPRPVIDPLVIDKHVDRYRPGSRKLVDVCALRGIELGDQAHGAEADAIAAGRLAQWMLAAPAMGLRDDESHLASELNLLHDAQQRWAADQAGSFADYLHSRGEHERALTVNGSWPLIPRAE